MFVPLFMSLPITIAIGPSPGGHRTVASGLSDLTELASEAASLTRITVPCLLTSHPPCWHLNVRSSSVPCLGQQLDGALALGERVGFPWAGPFFLRSPWAQAGGRAWSGAEGSLGTGEALSHSKGGWVRKLSEEGTGAMGPLGAGAQR